MTTPTLDQKAIIQRIGQAGTSQPFGPAGFGFIFDFARQDARIIVTLGAAGPEDRDDRVHASISRTNDMPTYADLVLLHRAVWGTTGYAYQVFVPEEFHVNIHANALHLWGLLDGAPELPRFGLGGSI